MGKFMVSLSDETEDKLRKEVERLYYGRVGGLSIFFEKLVRDYLEKQRQTPSRKAKPAALGGS